jgi:hypothetical protein
MAFTSRNPYFSCDSDPVPDLKTSHQSMTVEQGECGRQVKDVFLLRLPHLPCFPGKHRIRLCG